jgi:hypothetical protein
MPDRKTSTRKDTLPVSGLQQRPVHREVPVRGQPPGPRPRHHLRQKFLAHVRYQQPASVLATTLRGRKS